jgi:hypothetical protein
MLCVGSGRPITTTENFVAIEQGLNQRHGGTGDRIRKCFSRSYLSLNAFCKADFNSI